MISGAVRAILNDPTYGYLVRLSGVIAFVLRLDVIVQASSNEMRPAFVRQCFILLA
jgi:hypothetical protein